MGCNCNKKTENWFNLEWVIDKATKICIIKELDQIVFKDVEGFSFIDAHLYKGANKVKYIKFEQ